MTELMDGRGGALAQARIDGVKLTTYPGDAPQSVDEALAVQDAMIAGLGDTVVGWKIGCTSEVAQKALGTDSPFFGPIVASRFYESGATVETSDTALRIVESEVAVKMGRTLEPRERDYEVGEVIEAVASVHPAIELVNRRAPGGLDQGLTWNIADCGVNDAFILGDGGLEVRDVDFPNISASVSVNGEARSAGRGSTALGGADRALTWLVNDFRKRGRTLEAGHVVTTGLITEIITAAPGDRIVADFGDLGSVSVTIA